MSRNFSFSTCPGISRGALGFAGFVSCGRLDKTIRPSTQALIANNSWFCSAFLAPVFIKLTFIS